MRVVVVGPVPPIKGGIAQHTAGVIRGLMDFGAEVSALTWDSQYPSFLYPGSSSPSNGPFAFQAAPLLHWAKPWTWSGGGRRARKADLLVVPWVTPLQALPISLLINAARPTKTVVVVHNALPHERRVGDVPLTRWALRNAAGAVVHSRSVAEDLAMLLPSLRTSCLPHPPNFSVPVSPFPPMDRIRFLIAGMIRPYKGVDLAIEAMEILRRRQIPAELTVAGEFWEPIEKYRRLVTDLGLDEWIVLRPGYLKDEGMGDLIQSHHVILLPYLSASQSGIAPIALAAKRPVIASDVGGLSEEIEHGVTGLLVEPKNSSALAIAMEEMCANISNYEQQLRHLAVPQWKDVARALVDVGE